MSNDDLGKQIVTKGCDILYFDSLHTDYRIFKISKESYDSIVPPLFSSYTHCFTVSLYIQYSLSWSTLICYNLLPIYCKFYA